MHSLEGELYCSTVRPAVLYGTECGSVKGQLDNKLKWVLYGTECWSVKGQLDDKLK